jgi:LmbE family N-acetylglucosaminyl deacetylase
MTMSLSNPKMLVIAPHPDDSILGAGGTISRFTKQGGEVTVLTIAAHMPPLYSEEYFHLTIREAREAHSVIGVKESIFQNIPALSVDKMSHHELNKIISDVLREVCPDILFMPYFDRNIDHSSLFKSIMVSSRPTGYGKGISIVAAYEVLSSTHCNAPHIEPNFTPNWVVDISDAIDTKIEALKCCESQIGPIPHPRSCEAVRALALFRGSQAGMAFGEGFYVIHMTLLPAKSG